MNNKSKILVIGNLGYVGSSLIPHLKSKLPDAILIGFDIGYFSGCVFSPILIDDNLLNEQIYGDVRHFDYELLTDIDHVIYLAAISNDPMGNVFQAQTNEINALAARAIAEQSKAHGGRSFTFASSCSIYGSGGEALRNENSMVQPLTAYAKSKVDAEYLLSPLADDGFIVTCFRFATACGVSARLRLDLVLNDFVVSALVNGTIDILSDGTPFRPLITVESMCEALEWGVQRPGSVGGEFLAVNAGFDSWNFSVKELAYLVRDMVPGTQVSINATAQPDKRSYRVDFAKYRELSGKNKSYDDMGVAIAKLIKMVTDSSYNDKNFRNSTFTRLNFLNDLLKLGKIDKDLKIISNSINIIN